MFERAVSMVRRSPRAAWLLRTGAAFALLAAMGSLAGCGEDSPGGSSQGGDGPSGPGSSSSASSGAGGDGSGGGSACTGSDVILDELRAGVQSAILARAASDGWPVKTCDGYLFVSDNPKLDRVAGDHDNWSGTPMAAEPGFAWKVLDVPPGSHYKFTDASEFKADPWSRSYTYDDFGEMSLVRPADAHLDRHFNVTDGVMAGRTIRVWVPADEYSRVLYAHDGQNLFDPNAPFGYWKLQDSAKTGILVVGIDNTPERMDEYTHVMDHVLDADMGGKGDAYADYIQKTVRPFIQKQYGEKGPIGTMGSSLGGLISFHIAHRYPDEYAFAASLSGTMGWGRIGDGIANETMIERYAKGKLAPVLYLDSGGDGNCFTDGMGSDVDKDGIDDDDPDAGDNYCENVQMRETLLGVGYELDKTLFYVWEKDAEHNEAAWAGRVSVPLGVFSKL